MEMIWMNHPLLPVDQLINEPAEAKIGLQQSGWQVTDPPMLLAPLEGFVLESDEAAVESRLEETPNETDGEE